MQPEDQVVTGEAIALDLRLAGAGSRGVAALIDYAIVVIAEFVVLFVVLLGSINGSDAELLTVVLVSEIGIMLGYPVAMETLWHGRTLGKAAMGLRTVRDDGGPIRFRHALVRGAAGVFLEKPGLTLGVGALISMLVTKRKKRLGDLAAGTVVVQDRVPTRIEANVAMPPQLAGWAASLDLSRIDDDLALRIRHFIARARELSPQALATIEHQLATEVTARVGPPPPGTPIWLTLTAVLAERRQRAFAASQPPPVAWQPPSPEWQPPPNQAPPNQPPPPGGFTLPG